jgi:exosome complex RNA-binding protein Csl4
VKRCRHTGAGDRGDVVLGWLTRLTVGLALLGLVGFDLVSLGAGRLQAEDRAQSAARAAVRSFAADQDMQRAYEAALAEVAEHGDPGDVVAAQSFTVTADGVVTLTLWHTAPTLVVEKIGPIRGWATTSATVTGRPVG